MKTEIISILPSGHGHKEVKIRYTNGNEYKHVTNDMTLIDEYNREVFNGADLRRQRKARSVLIQRVKHANNLR